MTRPKQIWRSLSKFAGHPVRTKTETRMVHRQWTVETGITSSSIQWQNGIPYVVYRAGIATGGSIPSFLNQYVANQKNRVSPEYHRQIRHYMRRFRTWCRDNQLSQLGELTRDDIEAFGYSLPATAGPITRRRHLEAVRAALRVAADKDLLDYKITRRIRMPINRATRERVVLTDAEIRRIQNKWPEPVRSFTMTMIWAGLRLREDCYLAWADVNFDAAEITISAKPDLGFSPKGTRYRDGTPDRVPLLPWLAETLDALPRLGRFVWDRGNDRPLYSDKWWGAIVKRQFRASGMPNAHAHACRHTFCTKLALSGVNRAVMPQIARHLDPSTTDRYIHAMMLDAHREMAKVKPV